MVFEGDSGVVGMEGVRSGEGELSGSLCGCVRACIGRFVGQEWPLRKHNGVVLGVDCIENVGTGGDD